MARLAILLLVTALAWLAVGRIWETRVAVLVAVLALAVALAFVRRPLGRRLALLLPLGLCLAMLAEYAPWPSPPDSQRSLAILAAVAGAASVACAPELLPSPAWRRRLGGACLSIAVLALLLIAAEWLVDRGRPREPYAVVPDTRQGPRGMLGRDPVLGMKLRPGFRGHFVHPQYAGQHVTVNREGYRGADWPSEIDPGETRILLLGDSALFGMGAEDDETIDVHLERGLAGAMPGRRFRVYGVGVPSYGPRQWQVQLERLHDPLRPAICLAMFHDTNDLQDCRIQFVESRAAAVHDGRLLSETVAPQVFVLPGASEVPPLWDRMYWVRYSALFRGLDQIAARALVRFGWTSLTFSYNHEFLRAMRREPDPGIAEEFDLAEAAYARMDAHCRERGSTFGIYRLPGILQCEPAAFRRLIAELGLDAAEFDRARPGSRVIDWARERGIPVLDLLPVLEVSEREQSLDFYREGHPRPRGNRRIAGELLEWLRTDPRLAAALDSGER